MKWSLRNCDFHGTSLSFSSNTTYLCFFFFFLINGLYFFKATAITQTVNPTAKLVIPIRIPTKEAKEEIETHPVTSEAKMRKSSL